MFPTVGTFWNGEKKIIRDGGVPLNSREDVFFETLHRNVENSEESVSRVFNS